ncbi:MAG TPA: tRNA (N6-isopentenyl adenosine(37)-C2)-methylthiotransferase MiaB [Spirochaetota bacterium]
MRYYIETFGCQMNKNDSELMELSMSSEGFVKSESRIEADILIFNTCSVRNTAERRATARIREARSHKRKAILVLAGCMAQRTGSQYLSKKYADIVVGPYQTPIIGRIVKEHIAGSRLQIFTSLDNTDFAPRISTDTIIGNSETPWHAYVTITHGCENFCTYCIVPYVRGKLISFSSQSILEYTKRLVEKGVISITLLGQNVDQYGQDNGEIPFHALLDSIASIDGLKRIQFLTSHPKDFSEDIIKVIRDHDNISRSIHLPMQSGSDLILKKMNRAYTLQHYKSLVDLIKKHLADEYALSSDFIVGFPGETDDDFKETLQAVRDIRFSDAFTYAYSPREGTDAFHLSDSIPQEIKIARLNELISIQKDITAAYRKGRVGKNDTVIVEQSNSGRDNEFFGKTLLNYPVLVHGSEIVPGSAIDVSITGCQGTTLIGSIMDI